jgi:hypothetical protein
MKNCTDCLTKTDVKKFFGNLGTSLAIFAGSVLMMVGFVTSLDSAFDWAQKPSETQKLEQKIDDMNRLNSQRMIYYSYEQPRWDGEFKPITNSDESNH